MTSSPARLDQSHQGNGHAAKSNGHKGGSGVGGHREERQGKLNWLVGHLIYGMASVGYEAHFLSD